MGNIIKKHGSFEEEWLLHKNYREWYYSTSILFDDDNNMYTCQYTLMHVCLGPFSPKVAMVALTDFSKNIHHYLQVKINRKTPLLITETKAAVENVASAEKTADGMHIIMTHKDFDIDLLAGYGKGAIWHCDNGLLQMGIPGEKEVTTYYSWTNMPTEGILKYEGKELHVKGKTWFDRQGGTYNITKMATQWEWFSLRFFDDEEVMLFTFPQNDPPYYDGTYIDCSGNTKRINNYKIESMNTIVYRGLKWSSGWKIHIDEKEQDYLIEPIQEGHMNFAYFEELCYVKNNKGDLVGYAFAELLPGVLNSKLSSGSTDTKEKIKMGDLFKRIEF